VCYSSYTGLFDASSEGGACWAQGTAVRELAAYGIPEDWIVVGKPITPADAGSGWVAAEDLATWVAAAAADARLNWSAGIMGWQFSPAAGPWLQQLQPALPRLEVADGPDKQPHCSTGVHEAFESPHLSITTEPSPSVSTTGTESQTGSRSPEITHTSRRTDSPTVTGTITATKSLSIAPSTSSSPSTTRSSTGSGSATMLHIRSPELSAQQTEVATVPAGAMSSATGHVLATATPSHTAGASASTTSSGATNVSSGDVATVGCREFHWHLAGFVITVTTVLAAWT
jgi:hypothetical protein